MWTGGSRLQSGKVGAAVAWREDGGWTGRSTYLGTNKEVFDAEVFAILRAVRLLNERNEAGQAHGFFGLSGCGCPDPARRLWPSPGAGEGGSGDVLRAPSERVQHLGAMDPGPLGCRGERACGCIGQASSGGQLRGPLKKKRYCFFCKSKVIVANQVRAYSSSRITSVFSLSNLVSNLVSARWMFEFERARTSVRTCYSEVEIRIVPLSYK